MAREAIFKRSIFVLQALLIAVVVGWVLDLQRQVFGLNLYSEQVLLAVLGLSIAICFLATQRFFWDPLAAALGLALCSYLAVRYPQLSNELTMRPLDGILTSAGLAVLVLEGTRRMAATSQPPTAAKNCGDVATTTSGFCWKSPAKKPAIMNDT